MGTLDLRLGLQLKINPAIYLHAVSLPEISKIYGLFCYFYSLCRKTFKAMWDGAITVYI